MENYQLYNDKELLLRIAKGDERAFRIFFDRYRDRFYAVALKMTRSDDVAQEMVQDIFMKIWQNRAFLDRITKPDTYFFTALYRQIYRHYKKLALERRLLKLIAESPTFRNITDETILAQESERLINEAITRLPKQQQIVFRLSKQDGLSREQIAEKLHISPNTVRNHLSDAIQSIKAYLNHVALIYLLLLAHSSLGS
ncbi:MAG: sigma-70 family RNA polymerase sigma factor [Chitinophagaceae bacterium]|nr:sigma-70 family RNA polymerase sigma factor [Chitinophagaceae bacterium]